ncbi:MAG: elongation factor 4 [Deltaproteobacteria bacterium]|nr:elongation factor 4 [Deltaproteobacteria bacterium]
MSLPQRIRNFCIIAHIDHGKSTLADRLMECTGALAPRERVDQYLDRMDLERERGITIKAQTVRLAYRAEDGETYQLNLIDTPGHVDFHYEVSRSLAACEGALLVVDASQGVQAQTLANALAATAQGLDLLPVINKIDLPNADVEGAKRELREVLGLDPEQAVCISAKTGEGVPGVLSAIVRRLPPPRGVADAPLRALVIDSWYDSYQGVVVLLRVVDGEVHVGQHVRLMATSKEYEVLKLGVFDPHPADVTELVAGEVGSLIAGIREVRDTQIGDTICAPDAADVVQLPGFRPSKPIVFAGLFPTEPGQYEELRAAMEKLALNDASFTYEPETSAALGFGFRCGFLGSLHLEIIQERLEREFGLHLISTAPTVAYSILTRQGEVHTIANPAEFPDPGDIDEINEPYALVTVHIPKEFVGNVLALCEERRGIQQHLEYFGTERVRIQYLLPFAELIFDFHDQLKSATRGYASLDYELRGEQPGDLVKLQLYINGEPVDALSVIVHRDQAYYRGREVVARLRSVIPRQLFDVAIQAGVGGRIIARETVKALRKDVTAKCYGGDITRKRKLLEKQKAGKKRMKRLGKVEIPQEAFLSVLTTKGTSQGGGKGRA